MFVSPRIDMPIFHAKCPCGALSLGGRWRPLAQPHLHMHPLSACIRQRAVTQCLVPRGGCPDRLRRLFDLVSARRKHARCDESLLPDLRRRWILEIRRLFSRLRHHRRRHIRGIRPFPPRIMSIGGTIVRTGSASPKRSSVMGRVELIRETLELRPRSRGVGTHRHGGGGLRNQLASLKVIVLSLGHRRSICGTAGAQ